MSPEHDTRRIIGDKLAKAGWRVQPTFSAGCQDAAIFQGVAPVGLIDGDRLLDLLFEHKIGVKERPATLYEFDEEHPTESIESETEATVAGH